MSDQAARQFADSVEIEEEPELAEHLDEMQLGQVYCWPRPDGWAFRAARKSGLSAEFQVQFEDFARRKAYMLALQQDPEHVDGWYRRSSDDGYQVTCRLVQYET